MAVRELKGVGGWILDVATGTGDIAIKNYSTQRSSEKGLRFGLLRADDQESPAENPRKGLLQSIDLSRGDAIAFPFEKTLLVPLSSPSV